MLVRLRPFAAFMLTSLLLWAGFPHGGLAAEGEPAPPLRPKTGKKWLDMDYGPFLSASIEAPQPKTNIAFKGIAVRLDPRSTNASTEAVVFDTDLLRYSAGWSGDFVALKGVVFDGEHWAYPQISGDQVFGNPHVPGWARDGSFTDPREFIYGPLPRDWAHWKGLYLQGQRVIFSYSVGEAQVLEMPGLERATGLAAFTRTINLEKSSHDLTVQVAFERDRLGDLVRLDDLRSGGGDMPAGRSIVVLTNRPKPGLETGRLKSALRAEEGLFARWEFEEGKGNVALDQSGHLHTLRLTNCLWEQGHEGGALAFNGKSYGQLDQPGDMFATNDFSVAAWIKPAGDGTIIAQTAPEGPWVPDGKSLFLRGGKLTLDVGWVGALESQSTIVNDRWTHVALTWSHQDGLVTLFINGVQDAAGTLKPRSATPGHVLRVGYTAPNFPQTPFFHGQMDSLRVYARNLQPEDILALAGAQPDTRILVLGVSGVSDEARWRLTGDGHARLFIPAPATPVQLKLFIARIPQDTLSHFADLVRRSPAALALEPFTHGGPSRWPQALRTSGRMGSGRGPYAIDAIIAPDVNPWDSWMRFGGFDFFKDATRAAICTWSGDVWIVSGIEGNLEHLAWRRFATGLFQPLGLKIVDDQIYVLGRDQITRLHDLNGDGEADFYENFNNDTMTTEHFHEFAMDLQTDAAGNFYYMKAGRHARDALHPQHGTLMKVSRDGSRSEIIAKGFRAPNGLEVAPDGHFYTTDQEGYWMPANRLNLIKPGAFHGNTWSWYPEGKPKTFEPPICWIHPRVDRSPSTMAWVTSDRWGPLKDGLLSLSYGVGRIFHVLHEEVNGIVQGGITPLPPEFDTGIMRSRFSPLDGQLYVCGLFGWAGNKTTPGGFYRVRYTGQPLHLPNELHIASNGVVFAFTEPLEAASATDIGNYSVEVWNYRWTENYGSPDFKLNGEKGRDRLAVKSAHVSRNGRIVFLELPGISPVMQMQIQMNLKSADGAPVQTFIHNTVHVLGQRPGGQWLGEEALAGAAQLQPKLAHEASGLKQLFFSPHNGPGASSSPRLPLDARVSRLAALRVPQGAAPTPFLPPGPFTSTWEGFLKMDLSESRTFHAVGRGHVSIKVNGAEAVPLTDLSQPAPPARLTSLRGGLNRLQLTYESPASGEAWVRLYWSSENAAKAGLVPPAPQSTGPEGEAATERLLNLMGMEPVAPSVFVHEAQDDDLARGRMRRLGRQLFGERHCAKCHAPSKPFDNAMPELSAEAPSLDHFDTRFETDWLIQWLQHPTALVPETTMPECLQGSPAEVLAQAHDIAAALVSTSSPPDVRPAPSQTPQQTTSHPLPEGEGRLPDHSFRAKAEGEGKQIVPPPAASATNVSDSITAGADLFSKLGCIACHLLPGDRKLDADTRRSLDYVHAKWQPSALVDFLRAPQKDYPWTRMPDFQLSRAEAESLAGFLYARTEPTLPPRPADRPGPQQLNQISGSERLQTPAISRIATNSPTPLDTAPRMPHSLGDARRGRELLASLGCVNCHTLTGLNKTQLARSLDDLAGGVWTTGCLANEPAQRGKAPAFGFDTAQAEALRHLLKNDLPSLHQTVWPEFARRQFDALRCSACHQQENAQDFWFGLEALEAVKKPKAANPYDDDATEDKTIHRQRPPLNLAGEKLRPEWMEQLFLGRLTYKPRPKLEARMPAFPAYAHGLAQGLALEHGCGAVSIAPGPANPAQVKIGQALVQKGALGCVDCHAMGQQPALAGTDTATINFAHIPQRLRKEYYDRYVLDPPKFLPGTMMPRFSNDDGLTGVTTYFNGDARQQFEVIWDFMKTVPAP